MLRKGFSAFNDILQTISRGISVFTSLTLPSLSNKIFRSCISKTRVRDRLCYMKDNILLFKHSASWPLRVLRKHKAKKPSPGSTTSARAWDFMLSGFPEIPYLLSYITYLFQTCEKRLRSASRGLQGKQYYYLLVNIAVLRLMLWVSSTPEILAQSGSGDPVSTSQNIWAAISTSQFSSTHTAPS